MQEFTTKENRHEFTVDGRKFWMPGVTIADFEEVSALDGMTDEQRIPAFTKLVTSRIRGGGFWGFMVRPRAVGRLTPMQLTELFGGWMGMTSGEASASPVSPAPTAQN